MGMCVTIAVMYTYINVKVIYTPFKASATKVAYAFSITKYVGVAQAAHCWLAISYVIE